MRAHFFIIIQNWECPTHVKIRYILIILAVACDNSIQNCYKKIIPSNKIINMLSQKISVCSIDVLNFEFYCKLMTIVKDDLAFHKTLLSKIEQNLFITSLHFWSFLMLLTINNLSMMIFCSIKAYQW